MSVVRWGCYSGGIFSFKTARFLKYSHLCTKYAYLVIYCNHISVLLGRSLLFRPHIRCETFVRLFKVCGSGTMASFRIHEDQENTALGLRKEADVFAAATQRRALGDLSQFAVHQNRNLKHVSCTPNTLLFRKSLQYSFVISSKRALSASDIVHYFWLCT